MNTSKVIRLLTLSLALSALAGGVGLSPASAKNLVHRHIWSDHNTSDPGLPSATVVASGKGWDALRIVGEAAGGASFPIARFADLRISEPQYALGGEVRYEAVDGSGYLEMWSVFPDGSRFFSRTQAPTGPLQSFRGDSDWRPYTLPFFLGESQLRPETIEVNLVLPGRGTVELGPISLIEFAPGEDAIADSTGSWWSDRTAALVGGIGGALLGLLGALVGILAYMGRARGLVTTLVILVAALGIGALVAGGVAFFGGQPYGVYYPLALAGVLAASLGLTGLFVLPGRYAAIELRRMDALDAR